MSRFEPFENGVTVMRDRDGELKVEVVGEYVDYVMGMEVREDTAKEVPMDENGAWRLLSSLIDEMDTTGAGEEPEYVVSAIERGRPSQMCVCKECSCPLHSYKGNSKCVWCRNGVHGEVKIEGNQ